MAEANDSKHKMKKSIRVKIISLGNPEVGKSCIIKRYCEKRFVPKYLATIGIDFGVTRVQVNGQELKVNIFDMAGHPLFYEVRNEFYADTQAVLLVFDVSDRQTFGALDDWLLELREEIMPTPLENIVVIVCANKIDRRRVVDEVEGRIWAETRGFRYFETSAQSGVGVSDMFQCLFEQVRAYAACGGRPSHAGASTSGPAGQRAPSASASGYARGAATSGPGGGEANSQALAATGMVYTKEQLEAIQRLKYCANSFEKIGLRPGATRDEINKAYRRLAVLLHPDKSVVPGSEEAFKTLVSVRTTLLKHSR